MLQTDEYPKIAQHQKYTKTSVPYNQSRKTKAFK